MNDFVTTPSNVAERTALSFAECQSHQHDAARDPAKFWAQLARSELTWITDFTIAQRGDFQPPVKVEYFPDGVLNVSANCLDRHLVECGEKIAIIWEGDDPNDMRQFTYRDLYDHVCRWANMLTQCNVKKGDAVVIYLPMIPEAAMAMLACARIGAMHSVVFAGFSAQSVKDRITNCSARLVITADEGLRGGKTVPLKTVIDDAVRDQPTVETILVVKRTHTNVPMQFGRDQYVNDLLANASNNFIAVPMQAEDPLFILYTSGSTGKPKGLVHTQAGYLLYASVTFRTNFDYRTDDIYFCTADVGWITGHSYCVYGPLANAATIVMFEGVPTYPTAERYWQIIDKYQVSIFYTAPTALRSLMQLGDTPLETTTRSSLRILGSVGEPINPEAWRWYFDHVGKQNCAVVDTWWQTETGGHMIAPPPGTPQMKPGWAMTPFWGIEPVLIDAQNNQITGAGEGALFIAKPWPGIARTIYGDHARFIQTYFSQAPGLYCTGDGAICDNDNFIQITGRVDDVINVSGHRFGTAEIESALVAHPHVAEAAIVGREHPIKGTGIYAYVTLNQNIQPTDQLKKELNDTVRQAIGAIASLDWLQWAPALPKTRSGKIMRRILRKIAAGELDALGDISTLADPSVIDQLILHQVK